MRCRCRSQTTVQNTRSETPPLFPDAMRSHANWHAACSMQLLLCVVSCFGCGCGCALGVINLHLHLPLFDFDFNFEPFAMWIYVGHGYVGVCYMYYVCTASCSSAQRQTPVISCTCACACAHMHLPDYPENTHIQGLRTSHRSAKRTQLQGKTRT